MCVCVCMPKSLYRWMDEIKAGLTKKGYTKDIPINFFKEEFMSLSGYNFKKVNEWVENFIRCKLIVVKNDKVNFQV